MPAACVHPTPDDVGRLLTQLLGRKVTAKRGTAPKAAALSTYAAPDGQLAAACVYDLEFANYAGAALPMVPCAVATDAIRAGKVEPELMENLAEVANIMTGLFNGTSAHGTSAHVKLRDMARLPPAPPRDVIALTAKPVRRLDLDIDITGYGMGRVAVFFGAPPLAA